MAALRPLMPLPRAAQQAGPCWRPRHHCPAAAALEGICRVLEGPFRSNRIRVGHGCTMAAHGHLGNLQWLPLSSSSHASAIRLQLGRAHIQRLNGCHSLLAMHRCQTSFAKQNFTSSTAPSEHSSGTLQAPPVNMHLNLRMAAGHSLASAHSALDQSLLCYLRTRSTKARAEGQYANSHWPHYEIGLKHGIAASSTRGR